eukprot:403346368
MQTPQIENSQNQQIPLSDNITIPLQDQHVNPLSQPPSADVNQSQKSHLDIEPLLNVQGPLSSNHHIEQNLKVQESQSSTNKMEDQETIKKSSVVSPEQLKAKVIADQKALEEKKKALEEQENAIQKSEKLKEIKPFLDDFLQAEDFFTDVVPNSFKEESKFRVFSDNSWYIEDNFVFNIEPKEWDNQDYFEIDKVRDNLELFFTIDFKGFFIANDFGIPFIRFRRLKEQTNKRIPIKSNFCLRIYSLTGLQLILSYDLPISHLNKDFRLQVYDAEYLSIICDDFFYYITYSDLMIFKLGDTER